jgi:drug/metabolite transporter (DMT)-like permease
MVVGSMGMLASSIAAFIMCKVLHFTDSSVHVSAGFYCRRMIPVGVAMAITVWTGNLVYLYLTVSFTQMLKAAGPVFIMVAMFLAKLETPTAQLMGSVLTICAGLIIAGSGEVNMSIVGVLVMLISEVGEAVRLVLTQILLQDLQLGPLDGLLYLVGSKHRHAHCTTSVPGIEHVIRMHQHHTTRTDVGLSYL